MDPSSRHPTTQQPSSDDEPTLSNGRSPAPNADPYVGKTIGERYTVERRIGQGGMGVVYAARHKVIDRRFAIKILRVEMVGAPDLVKRFLNEARAASSIGNPHIVDVIDFGELPDGAPYFVMEHLDGESLAARMTERRGLPAHDIVRIASEIANGLHAAHEAGIVHRDLKPDNVMLQRGGEHRDFVKVLDFGIAKVTGESKRLTMVGSVFGTPHYMSPEQAEGKSVDRRTDIYSLGVMMYEMAVGRVPFEAENYMVILSQHMHKAPTPVRELRGDIPPALDAIITRCLAKNPRDRFATMAALITALGVGSQGVASDAAARGAGVASGVPRAAFVALAGLMLAGIAFFLARPLWQGRADIRSDEKPSAASASGALPPPSGTNGASASAIVPPATAADLTTVTIIGIPLDSNIKRDEIDVGVSPKDISIAAGETARITVSRDGYVSRTIAVDGTKPRLEVQLKRTGEPAAAVPPTPTLAPPRPSASAKPKCPQGERFIYDKCEHL